MQQLDAITVLSIELRLCPRKRHQRYSTSGRVTSSDISSMLRRNSRFTKLNDPWTMESSSISETCSFHGWKEYTAQLIYYVVIKSLWKPICLITSKEKFSTNKGKMNFEELSILIFYFFSIGFESRKTLCLIFWGWGAIYNFVDIYYNVKIHDNKKIHDPFQIVFTFKLIVLPIRNIEKLQVLHPKLIKRVNMICKRVNLNSKTCSFFHFWIFKNALANINYQRDSVLNKFSRRSSKLLDVDRLIGFYELF